MHRGSPTVKLRADWGCGLGKVHPHKGSKCPAKQKPTRLSLQTLIHARFRGRPCPAPEAPGKALGKACNGKAHRGRP